LIVRTSKPKFNHPGLQGGSRCGHRYLHARASNLILFSSSGRCGDGRRSYLIDWLSFIQADKGGLYLRCRSCSRLAMHDDVSGYSHFLFVVTSALTNDGRTLVDRIWRPLASQVPLITQDSR
jgi:hypothetical protein